MAWWCRLSCENIYFLHTDMSRGVAVDSHAPWHNWLYSPEHFWKTKLYFKKRFYAKPTHITWFELTLRRCIESFSTKHGCRAGCMRLDYFLSRDRQMRRCKECFVPRFSHWINMQTENHSPLWAELYMIECITIWGESRDWSTLTGRCTLDTVSVWSKIWSVLGVSDRLFSAIIDFGSLIPTTLSIRQWFSASNGRITMATISLYRRLAECWPWHRAMASIDS